MRNLFAVLLLLIAGSKAFAEGKIRGVVRDSTNAETLIGASVSIFNNDNTTAILSTTTDIDGQYIFEVKAGIYQIEIKYIGYQTKRLTEITVEEGKTTTTDVSMNDKDNKELNEVVIQSSLKKETVNALYMMQKNAVAVSDGISADVIKRSPDRSTGEVLKRVSGTTIQDNKFVIIRGLSDRYNTAMVDGSPLPSTEPNRKAFSFDIIPANMIDNIVITKSGTPDLPGDFAGGVINILTKEVPEDNFANIAIGTSMNSASTFKTFKSGYRTPTDFLGFDNCARQLPSSFPDKTTIEALNPNKPEQSAPYLNMLNNDFNVKEHKALPGVNLQGSLGRVYYLKGNSRFGVTAAVTYNHTENIKQDLIRQYDNFDYKDNVYNYSSNLGGLLNLGYYVGKSKFNLKTLYNRIFDDNFLYRDGQNIGSSKDINFYAYDLVQKSLFKTTLTGEHQIGKKDARLDWMVSYNYITNNQPDQRKVSYGRAIGTDEPFKADVTTLGKSNSRLFSDMGESILNGGVNFLQPIHLFKKSGLKVGAFGQYRSRDFKNRYLGSVINTQKEDYDAVLQRPVGTLFATDLINNGYYTLEDQTGDLDYYTAHARTMGGYAMMDNRITEKFRAVWGARFESYNVVLNSVKQTEVDKTWNDILPSVNLTYSPNEKSNFRASYFRSLVRPEFRELTNLGYYDYELSATITGNPALTRTSINNFDLRYEWFLGKGEIISASVFYKAFSNTLENSVYGVNSSYDIKTENFDKATTVGFEIELRKNLGFIKEGSSFFKSLNFYTNFAYIHSKVSDSITITGTYYSSRPLSGQAPIVINSSIGYSSNNGKWNFNLLYNRIGQRLSFIGGDRFGMVYESPRNLLDFQLSFAATKHSELRLNLKDLINNPIRFYFDQDKDGKFSGTAFADGHISSDKDWIWQEYKPGRGVSLTYSYKF